METWTSIEKYYAYECCKYCRCKQVVAKMDVLQQRLLDKTGEIEEERQAKEEVLKRFVFYLLMTREWVKEDYDIFTVAGFQSYLLGV